MKRWPLALLGLVMVAAAVSAATFTIGEGSVIEYGNTTITMGQNFTFSSLTFSSAGAPILDGITLNLTSGIGYGNWTLTNFTQTRIVLVGNLTATGAIGVNGPAQNYVIRGLGPVGIQMAGNSPVTYPISAGARTISIERVGTVSENIGDTIDDWIPTLVGLFLAATVVTLMGLVLFARRG